MPDTWRVIVIGYGAHHLASFLRAGWEPFGVQPTKHVDGYLVGLVLRKLMDPTGAQAFDADGEFYLHG